LRDGVFDLLLRAEKITQPGMDNMLSWKHSGFCINKKVQVRAGDQETLANLAEYISRCPFSLTRILSVNPNGKVIYRAVKKAALPFPKPELRRRPEAGAQI